LAAEVVQRVNLPRGVILKSDKAKRKVNQTLRESLADAELIRRWFPLRYILSDTGNRKLETRNTNRQTNGSRLSERIGASSRVVSQTQPEEKDTSFA